MSFEDTRPAPLDEAGSAEFLAEFRVTDPFELRALLRSLMDQTLPVNLSTPDGSSYTSTVWALDLQQDRIAFTADAAAPAVQALTESDEATAVAYLDRIKLQFDLVDVVLVQGAQASVLQARLPRELFRFQRRGSFRVRTLDRTRPTATFHHPAIPDMQLALRVVDVSIGGCALMLPANVPELAPGVLVHGAHVTLDGDTAFDVQLLLHHVTSNGHPSGQVRVGCEFMGLGRMDERALQVYIDQTQKKRRMLSLD